MAVRPPWRPAAAEQSGRAIFTRNFIARSIIFGAQQQHARGASTRRAAGARGAARMRILRSIIASARISFWGITKRIIYQHVHGALRSA